MAYKKSAYTILIPRDQYTIAYNSYSGSLCKLDVEGVACLENLDESSPFFSAMVGQGLVVDSDLEEFERVIREYNEYIHDDAPETMQYTIALTTACNLRCIYCFEESHVPEFASPETMDAIVNYIKKELAAHPSVKNLHITWFGGEPMLTYEQIISMSETLIDACHGQNVRYSASMITNGLLLTEEKLRNLHVHGLSSVQITLDGSPEDCEKLKKGKKQDFEQLINNLPLFERICKIKVRLNACLDNLPGIIGMYRALTQLNPPLAKVYISKIEKYCDSCAPFTAMSESAYTDLICDMMQEAVSLGGSFQTITRFPKRRKAYCGSMQKLSGAVGPDGSLYVCEHFIADKTHAIGNVKDKLPADFKNDTEYSDFTALPYHAGCAMCDLFPVCLGGCPANRLYHRIPLDCGEFRKNTINELILAAENRGK